MSFSVIQTEDERMRKLLAVAENVASSRAAVLIQGESGTGKELLARFIHSKSHRASKKFVAVNCAAVPENLLESELFGYERGAFTGADQRKVGRFEIAHESTFLLDEIGDMPLALQAKILRVIQESEIERLGGREAIRVNVRIIATTHRDLSQMVQSGQFREDLFYRLNVIPLRVPPLRLRAKDIVLLSNQFVETSCRENGISPKRLSDEALKKIKSWSWPGNVRELNNVLERSVLLCSGQELGSEEILIEGYEAAIKDDRLAAGMKISDAERLLIEKTLEFTEQNRTRAAHLLGISIRTLRNKLNEYRAMESSHE